MESQSASPSRLSFEALQLLALVTESELASRGGKCLKKWTARTIRLCF
jgi:hypothetical protein